jgi:hypothetical protein
MIAREATEAHAGELSAGQGEAVRQTDEPRRHGPADAVPSIKIRVPAERQWQERMLPLMVWMVVGLTVFFFAATLAQLAYLNVSIQRQPSLDPRIVDVVVESELPREFQVLALLDASTLDRRYHQNNVQLMSRVWARYLGFITGMILSLVGAVFVLGKLREDGTQLQAAANSLMVNIRSASPGLIMAVLGVALMITTIVTHHTMEWADSSVYLRMAYPTPGVGPAVPVDPNFP